MIGSSPATHEQTTVRGHQIRACAALGAILLLFVLSGSAFAGDRSGGASCRPQTLTDFDAPLQGLPPLASLPSDGIVAFAPSSVHLRMSRPAAVPVNYVGASIPFSIENQDLSSPIALNWVIGDQVSRVRGPATGSGEQVEEAKRQIGTLAPGGSADISTAAIHQPGIYRVTLTIEDSAGVRLGTYEEYARVMRRRLAVRMAVRGPGRVAAGGVLDARLENRGTETVGYGAAYALDRLVNGRWIGAGGSGRTLSNQTALEAGTTSVCAKVSVPEDAAPGRYRVRKAIFPFGSDLGPPRSVSAEFFVR